jgi:lysophospholipase L1-like esterase
MLIDHHPNWVALQANDPTTFQSYIADGVHPNAEGIGKITFPLLQWKLSGGLPLPTGGAR